MPKVCREGDLGATGHGCTAFIGVYATQGEVFAPFPPKKRTDECSNFDVRKSICFKNVVNSRQKKAFSGKYVRPKDQFSHHLLTKIDV